MPLLSLYSIALWKQQSCFIIIYTLSINQSFLVLLIFFYCPCIYLVILKYNQPLSNSMTKKKNKKRQKIKSESWSHLSTVIIIFQLITVQGSGANMLWWKTSSHTNISHWKGGQIYFTSLLWLTLWSALTSRSAWN